MNKKNSFEQILENINLYFKNIDYKDIFKSILWAAIIALIFRTFLFEPFRIPSTSMLPNLKVGDFFFASKYAYGYSTYSLPVGFNISKNRLFGTSPERGDIVVFKIPQDRYTYYIKRLVGLPGDKIQLKRSILYINGVAVKRNYNGTYRQKTYSGENILFTKYLETLPNGIEYEILDASLNSHRNFPDNTGIYEVPDGHYFMMGDNRNNSQDSRFINEMGYIPEENIVGKAYFMFWTSDFTIKQLIDDFSSARIFKFIH